MRTQFEPVSCKYGAPMGREPYGQPEGKIHLFRVSLVNGYDDGGAYWGTGAPLYCARGVGFLYFIRSENRRGAWLALVNDYQDAFASGAARFIQNDRDGRFSVAREWCGAPATRWAVRFCGRLIAYHNDEQAARAAWYQARLDLWDAQHGGRRPDWL